MSTNWWGELEAILEAKSVLKHPFYQAWTAGRLTREDLALYAGQYYRLEVAFPRFVKAAADGAADACARAALEANLRDELGEDGQPSHRELWLRFAESVGASRESVERTEPRPETLASIDAFDSLTRAGGARAAAALYAYEAQQPAVARTKREGLAERYGIVEDRAVEFFRVHETADAWHSEEEKKAALRAVETGADSPEAALDAARRACDALNQLLDGVWRDCQAKAACPC